MRESDDKSGYTMVDHVTFDVIIPLLSTSAQSVFFRIYRQTIGWSRPTDKISNSQFIKICGIKNHETVKAAVEELKKFGLIVVNGETAKIKQFKMNMDTLERYRTAYSEGKLKDLGNLSTELSTWLSTGKTT